MAEFTFCPNTQVPETIAREPTTAMSLNGWQFTSRPSTPYQRRFKVTLHGLRWFLDDEEAYDAEEQPTINARALELFYEEHERWKPFEWTHPHLGDMVVRFDAVVNVPAGIKNSYGLVEPLEVMFVENNPGY